MKFIKRKVNPHYLSDLGSMNQSKCIIGPSVSLLTVPAFLNLECRAFCSRMRSQQIHCIWSLQVHPWEWAFPFCMDVFFYMCVCSFMCMFVCIYVFMYMIYTNVYVYICMCVVILCVSRCVHLTPWFLRTSLGNIAWALMGLKISLILLW